MSKKTTYDFVDSKYFPQALKAMNIIIKNTGEKTEIIEYREYDNYVLYGLSPNERLEKSKVLNVTLKHENSPFFLIKQYNFSCSPTEYYLKYMISPTIISPPRENKAFVLIKNILDKEFFSFLVIFVLMVFCVYLYVKYFCF